LHAYRPQCRRCGALTFLATIEPLEKLDHDLRTFECEHCGQTEVVKMRIR
jgi:ribosomal protein S27AE